MSGFFFIFVTSCVTATERVSQENVIFHVNKLMLETFRHVCPTFCFRMYIQGLVEREQQLLSDYVCYERLY